MDLACRGVLKREVGKLDGGVNVEDDVLSGFLDVEAAGYLFSRSLLGLASDLLDNTLTLKDELFQIRLEDQVIMGRVHWMTRQRDLDIGFRY